MGIQILSQPESEVDAGIFNLPKDFDTKVHAAKWVAEGNAVEKAKERQTLIGTRLHADGWTVYTEKGKPVKRSTERGGSFILMFRPREIQDAVNAVFGNVGKERMIMHKKGESTSGGVPLNPGILTEEQVVRQTGERASEEDGAVIFNPIPMDSETLEVAPLQTS
jgi:hypothetical protein